MPRALAPMLVLAATLLPGAFPATQVAAVPNAPEFSRLVASADFNGDGRFDLAVGAPGEDVGAAADAGAVNIFYSTGTALPSVSQALFQGNPEAGDQFGAALTAGNFNGDAFTDLAVGAPGEDIGAAANAGAVNVFFGSTRGLRSLSQALFQGNPEAGDQFGAALTAETFNGDAFTDLAVGAPGEDIGAVDTGAVNVFSGSSGGLGSFSRVLLQGNPEAGDRFGAALTTAFFSNDTFADLAVGAPGENVGGIVDAGAVSVFYDTSGVLPPTSQTLLQGNPEAGDRLGAALTAGFFNGNFNADLAVGAPGEDVGAAADAGAVNVFDNPTGRLQGTSGQALFQGNVEAGDRFGAALAAGPFRGFGFFDLVVGAPGENVGGIVDAGAVSVFYDTSGVLPPTSQTLLQGNVEAGDRFGAALTVGFFSDPSESFVDLAVGAPGENVGGIVDAGAANVFYHTTPTGVLPSLSDQTLLQGNPEAGDRFGTAFDI